jgi:hypothetical protein
VEEEARIDRWMPISYWQERSMSGGTVPYNSFIHVGVAIVVDECRCTG